MNPVIEIITDILAILGGLFVLTMTVAIVAGWRVTRLDCQRQKQIHRDRVKRVGVGVGVVHAQPTKSIRERNNG